MEASAASLAIEIQYSALTAGDFRLSADVIQLMNELLRNDAYKRQARCAVHWEMGRPGGSLVVASGSKPKLGRFRTTAEDAASD
jgi:hypothetical protein